MPSRSIFTRKGLAPAALFTLAFTLSLLCLPGPALAVSADCPALFELYRACNAEGQQTDHSKACLEASSEAMARALVKTVRKSPQTARALVELVCNTGCDDALTRQPPATRQEFSEAFCD
ncbi:MAG: hypothetical protein KKF77_15615 [Proteobacteria bacterium]|nr:hypothetical protein [Pseudomonadota bacterium]